MRLKISRAINNPPQSTIKQRITNTLAALIKVSEEKFQSDSTIDIKLSESEFILNFAQKF